MHVRSPLSWALAAAVATFAGGLVAIGLRRRAAEGLALSAGVVAAVALLDLAPDALGEAGSGLWPWALVCGAAGFLTYGGIDRALSAGAAGDARAHVAAASLTAHSLIDGLGIGLAFQASASAGLAVGVAVVAHDMADGLNTVAASLGLARRPRRRIALAWLAADALAPLAGVGLASLAHPPPGAFWGILAALAGGFLSLGAAQAREAIARFGSAAPAMAWAAAGAAAFCLAQAGLSAGG